MALGAKPTLIEINTELGTTGQSLSTCISNAGKTGVWDRQSDFAFFSADSKFYETPASGAVGGADIVIYKIPAPKTTTLKRIELKAFANMSNRVVDLFKAAFADLEQVANAGETFISSRSPVKRVTGLTFTVDSWLSIDIDIAITNGEDLSFAVYDGGNVIPDKDPSNFYVNLSQGVQHFSNASGQLGGAGTAEILIRMFE